MHSHSLVALRDHNIYARRAFGVEAASQPVSQYQLSLLAAKPAAETYFSKDYGLITKCVCDVVQVSEWQSRLGAAFCTLLGAAAEAAAPIATLFLQRF